MNNCLKARKPAVSGTAKCAGHLPCHPHQFCSQSTITIQHNENFMGEEGKWRRQQNLFTQFGNTSEKVLCEACVAVLFATL